MKGGLLILLLSIVILSGYAQQALIMHGHAHNDYKHTRPLLDAIDNGFFSVEADIYLRNGDLPIAHTPFEIKKGKSLKSLYLEPLKKLVTANNGRVYANGPLEFVLMIDLKNGGPQILKILKAQLEEYKSILTVYEHGIKKPGAVRIVLSGRQDPAMYKSDEPRYVSSDGNLQSINTTLDSTVEPRASAPYHTMFSWNGGIQIDPAEGKELIDLINRAHRFGRQARFYGLPEREDVWKVLLDSGIDWISVDNLPRFRKFYLDYMAGK